MIITQKDRMVLNRVHNALYKDGHEVLMDELRIFIDKIQKLDETFKKLYGN